MIREITFEEIYPLWEELWRGRDFIKPQSSMCDFENQNMAIYDKCASGEWDSVFYGVFTDDTNELIACNSGYQSTETTFRSRGLYVKYGYGGKGIGQLLLQKTIDFAKEKNKYDFIWSFPRMTAVRTYEAVGYLCTPRDGYDESWEASGVMQKEWNAEAILKLK